MLVQGSARVGFIIGRPIAQVKSPGLFNQHVTDTAADRVLVPDLKARHRPALAGLPSPR